MDLSILTIYILSNVLIQGTLMILEINLKQFLDSWADKFLLDSLKHCILRTYSSRHHYSNTIQCLLLDD
ncbi:hypothetical protein B0533_13555 [Sedimentibacter sp. SX930]|nr:hypothetical protein B0533_13555 [Sedimentibacter sp. SX930]